MVWYHNVGFNNFFYKSCLSKIDYTKQKQKQYIFDDTWSNFTNKVTYSFTRIIHFYQLFLVHFPHYVFLNPSSLLQFGEVLREDNTQDTVPHLPRL